MERRTTGSVVCPSCGRLVGVSEPKCPHCGAWQPGLFGYGPALQRAFGGQFDLTGGITVACGILYVLSLALDPAAIFRMRGIFDILSPSGRSLFQLGMTGGLAWAAGQWWTLCTAVFLHGSLLHIVFNMLIMRQYMPNVVELFGVPRAFLIFMAGGIGGFLVSNLAPAFLGGGHPTIGASGAIFGLFGALIAYGRRTGQSYITQQLGMSALFMFLMGFMMSSTNNWAHAGGFAAGYGASVMMHTSGRREGPGLVLLAAGIALVTLAGFVLSFLGVAPLFR